MVVRSALMPAQAGETAPGLAQRRRPGRRRSLPGNGQEQPVAIEHLFAGIPVSNYRAVRPWYEQLFGRPPDVDVSDHECMWQLTTAGWVYIVEDPARAGYALFTLLVDDLPAHITTLAARGLTTSPIETMPGAARTATITDADGNLIKFGEDLSKTG
jgi:predicted enzyme related to lactoylglutathione lyase